MTGLTPNSTSNDYSLGLYTSSGSQVAKVQNNDGTWPSRYGYSSDFTLAADQAGRAARILTLTINPSVKGAASLRLRMNGKAAYTENVMIGNVPVE